MVEVDPHVPSQAQMEAMTLVSAHRRTLPRSAFFGSLAMAMAMASCAPRDLTPTALPPIEPIQPALTGQPVFGPELPDDARLAERDKLLEMMMAPEVLPQDEVFRAVARAVNLQLAKDYPGITLPDPETMFTITHSNEEYINTLKADELNAQRRRQLEDPQHAQSIAEGTLAMTNFSSSHIVINAPLMDRSANETAVALEGVGGMKGVNIRNVVYASRFLHEMTHAVSIMNGLFEPQNRTEFSGQGVLITSDEPGRLVLEGGIVRYEYEGETTGHEYGAFVEAAAELSSMHLVEQLVVPHIASPSYHRVTQYFVDISEDADVSKAELAGANLTGNYSGVVDILERLGRAKSGMIREQLAIPDDVELSELDFGAYLIINGDKFLNK